MRWPSASVRSIGVRLAPNNLTFDMPFYPDNEATYLYLAEELGKRGLAYVHLNDNQQAGQSVLGEPSCSSSSRPTVAP